MTTQVINQRFLSKGFTLIEIMVVVVIIALAGSMLVFGYQQTLNRQKDALAEQVQAWLEAASDTAIFQSTVIGVAQQDNHLVLLAYFQNDWFLLGDQEPLPLDGELLLNWSQELIDNAEFYSQESERLSPYLVLMPTGQILPEGRISFLDKDDPRASIHWENGYDMELVWQQSL